MISSSLPSRIPSEQRAQQRCIRVMYNTRVWEKERNKMQQMVRKQIYIERRQEARLKRLAKKRGVSEAEIIRQALERELNAPSNSGLARDHEAWEKALELMRGLRAKGPDLEQRRDWKREDAYEERLR